ncbi:MAG TPA: energy transducer TonB, partial [Bacteroidales bacterium]|nr:energy transducer TonB [Bacteroidales bacterium]
TNLYKNLKYPEEAINKKISGTVIVNFIVEIDGRITNVKALNDIGGGCGLAAENLIKSLPKWNPGKQNGKPVRVRYSLPVKFD